MKTVRSIKRIEQEPVYDVTVDGAHHYILDNGLVTHNSGLKYAADYIIYLSRKKEKDGKEVVGHVIHCKNHKSRLTKENKIVDVLLRYDSGLHRYYGLVDLAVECEIFKKNAGRIELPDGSKQFEKRIYADPTKYFTEDVLNRLDQYCEKEFSYGSDTTDTGENVNAEYNQDDS